MSLKEESIHLYRCDPDAHPGRVAALRAGGGDYRSMKPPNRAFYISTTFAGAISSELSVPPALRGKKRGLRPLTQAPDLTQDLLRLSTRSRTALERLNLLSNRLSARASMGPGWRDAS